MGLQVPSRLTIEPLIKQQAVELAGTFYEFNSRSDKFRRAFPTVEHYLKGWQVMADGVVKKIAAGWMHHVVLARRLLVEMLKQPDGRVSPAMKERISEAIIADRGKSERFGQRLHQRMDKGEYVEEPLGKVIDALAGRAGAGRH